MRRNPVPALVASLLALSGAAHAQGLPTTQPALLTIYIEDIKPGHQADHVTTESGWPAAFERAGSPDALPGARIDDGRPARVVRGAVRVVRG